MLMDEFIEFWKTAKNRKEVADHFGISTTTVDKWRKICNLKPLRKKGRPAAFEFKKES